ncbi:MAG: hypothetical protein C5B57_07165 [Blastocatellia bacterium]|nr:MAG: hypothetical protein C5B57_07165 [Blastocatellia bacterium]
MPAGTVESDTKLTLDVGGGREGVSVAVGRPARARPLQAHFLNDTSSGDFCVPFGFCQSVLQQVEFAAGAVLRS